MDELFLSDDIKGKVHVFNEHSPSFDIESRRLEWLQLIKENPDANRSQLKEKGKGLHTWIYRHDGEWYEKVTPRMQKRKKSETIDWKQRDKECLKMARNAVNAILNRNGKPIRVCPSNIRRVLGVGSWFNNEKLIYTNRYMQDTKEDIDSFRIRKIKWAIEEMIANGEELAPYKVQLYAGFGGGNKEVRKLIIKVFEDF
ncbi:TnsD family Tn7-like transposition protein [Neobacillus sp.]|uniref:TnsD family Tn7-like transposition protein n=1 Tax=Neobacillus sp. TaxID=2675273 RepID=UPI0035B53FF5